MRLLLLSPGGPQEQLAFLPAAATAASRLGTTLQVACAPAAAPVWALLPAVEKVLPFDFDGRPSLADWTNLLGAVREPDFQACLNRASGWQLDLLLSLSHIPVRVARGGWSATSRLGPDADPDAMLAALGLDPVQADFRLTLPAGALRAAVEQQPAGDGPLLVLTADAAGLEPVLRQRLAQVRLEGLRPGSPLAQAAQLASADVLVGDDPWARRLAQLTGVAQVALAPGEGPNAVLQALGLP
ncbi:MAG: glycosyltransferase family 9 protein [Synechococcus sp.]